MDPDGRNVREVPVAVAGLGPRFDWSPDGEWIAFSAGGGSKDIYIMHPDGSELVQVTNGGHNRSPSFSPDSQWLVFASTRDSDNSELYIVNLDDFSDVRRVTEGRNTNLRPVWQP